MSSSLARTLHLAFLNLQMKIIILSNRHCTRMIDIIFFLHFINFESIQCNIFSQKKTFEMTNCIEKDCSRYISNELVHQSIFRKSEQQRSFRFFFECKTARSTVPNGFLPVSLLSPVSRKSIVSPRRYPCNYRGERRRFSTTSCNN